MIIGTESLILAGACAVGSLITLGLAARKAKHLRLSDFKHRTNVDAHSVGVAHGVSPGRARTVANAANVFVATTWIDQEYNAMKVERSAGVKKPISSNPVENTFLEPVGSHL